MIGVKEVEHIAKLARLALSDDEKRIYTDQIAKIIDCFDELKAVDTEGVEPLAHALSLVNVMREDVVEKPPGNKVMLSNAPAREDDYFKVPKIGE